MARLDLHQKFILLIAIKCFLIISHVQHHFPKILKAVARSSIVRLDLNRRVVLLKAIESVLIVSHVQFRFLKVLVAVARSSKIRLGLNQMLVLLKAIDFIENYFTNFDSKPVDSLTSNPNCLVNFIKVRQDLHQILNFV